VRVVEAAPEDIDSWLNLAGEVEYLFGPMVDKPEFHRALLSNLARSTALCIRGVDGPPGTPLLGGLLFSPHQPRYVISWLAVTANVRNQGIGKELIREALRRFVSYPCTLEVEAFGLDHPGARSRSFYEQLGFRAEEDCPPGPDGGSRQIFRLPLVEAPVWVD
jgi:ribosomal protein S18 acetylase RimI-like enzyme